jgi:hypothetical protein
LLPPAAQSETLHAMTRLAPLLLLLAACGGGSMQQLNQLARDDLQCEHNLMFTKIDEKTRKAEGCGKTRTYVEVCDAKEECRWVQDTGTSE